MTFNADEERVLSSGDLTVIEEVANALRVMHVPVEGTRYCTFCEGKDKYPCDHIRLAEDLEDLL